MIWAAAAALCIAMHVPLSAHAFEARVPPSFFGLNAPELQPLSLTNPAGVDRELSRIRDIGVDWIRSDATWADVEPAPALAGVHVYVWAVLDTWVARLARHGLTLQPMPNNAPLWARSLEATTAGCGMRGAVAGHAVDDYGAYVRALVERYGRGGRFWASRPELPYKPVTTVEIWNEPNWSGVWCPTPDPETYGRLAEAGADGVHGADRQARAMLGGLVTIKEDLYAGDRLRGMEAGRFLDRVAAAAPGLAAKLDAAAIHLYDADRDVNVSLIGWARARLEDAGYAAADLEISEFGWHTRGDQYAITEAERAANYRLFVSQLARTDCRLTGIAPYTWISNESSATSPADWFGLAKRGTTTLYPSGQAYAEQVALFRGKGPTPAPRDTITICGALPPDQDGDSVPDETDDYPLDPGRTTGSEETPPPDPTKPPPPPPPSSAPRLPATFFGFSTPTMPWQTERRRDHYDAIDGTRIGTVRDYVSWQLAEPSAPVGSTHKFAWSETDSRMLNLGRRGIRAVPTFVRKPSWVSASTADANLAAFTAAYARRYGRGGSFWRENGNLDEALLAPRDYEVWHQGNFNGAAWDGSASAAEYASAYTAVRQALRSVDSQARAIVSLDEYGGGGRAEDFVRAMVAARPALAGNLDGAYVLTLNGTGPAATELLVRRVREALSETGNSAAPIYVGFGAFTAGPDAVTEAARASLYAETVSRLSRSDCGVEGLYLYAWTVETGQGGDPWASLGVADLATAGINASGRAFRDALAPFLGYGTAARPALDVCAGPPPDRDGDGVPDERDDSPLDADAADATAPTLRIAGPAGGRRARTRARFDVSASDASSGVGTVTCRLDSRSAVPCAGRYETPRLKAGKHRLVVVVSDRAGNRSQTTRGWRTKSRR